MLPTRQRLLSRVSIDLETGCWNWTGVVSKSSGYGQICTGNRKEGTRKTAYAHRLSYEEFVGPIPEDLVIDHLCRNRKCINPEHLEPVSNLENILRGLAPTTSGENNRSKTHCNRGHPYSGYNLTYRKSGGRACKECHRLWGIEKRKKKKA